MHREESVFPFTAVVGQDQVKQGLLLNAVSHQVGGILIRGRRGTAKSTLARGLAHLLPEIEVVTDCPFSCDPHDSESLCSYCAERLAVEGSLPVSRTRMKMVTLPLNATEEMVSGTLDIEKALRQGEKSFEPGILARANRSILYVDEVNLLEDHIVDVLLDSAAMGINVVEREGISFRHGARFILVGTMNPDEGDLRPQLEDRFGLCAEVETEMEISDRLEILRRSLLFSRNPLEFESLWHAAQERLRRVILTARDLYPGVEVGEPALEMMAQIVNRAGADGHRAEISMLHAAMVLAAIEEHPIVETEHIARVAKLALNHRIRKMPFGIEEEDRLDVEALISEIHSASIPFPLQGTETSNELESGIRDEQRGPRPPEREPDRVMKPAPEDVCIPESETSGTTNGRRGDPRSNDSRGRYYRSASPRGSMSRYSPSDIAIDATIRASAARGVDGEGKLEILPEDIKLKLKKRRCGASIVFVVDASASMGVKKRLDASRQAILKLLVEAYQKRDKVGLVVFKDQAAQLVLTPTSSAALADRLLTKLTPGGTTPLSHGLSLGYQILDHELSRSPQPSPVLVLISDGGGNITMGGSANPLSEALVLAKKIREKGIQSVVIDSAPVREDGNSLFGRPTAARRISDAMGASYHSVRNLTCEAILETVNRSTSHQPTALTQASR
ncbi:MAG: VWA domain-containing protein [Actinobacteria bacterium]|nr:VWA domain-containing protein [Actinomycetota bacterium]